MTDKQELLPCPFCGGLAKLAAHGFSNSKVTCAANYCCEALSVAAWNHRTPDPELAKVTAERDEALTRIEAVKAELTAARHLVQQWREDTALIPAFLASRTLAIKAAIEAMEPFRRVERAIPPKRPDHDIVAIEMYHMLSEEAVAQIGASSRNARLVLSLDGINAGHFRKLMSILAQLRSLIAGRD